MLRAVTTRNGARLKVMDDTCPVCRGEAKGHTLISGRLVGWQCGNCGGTGRYTNPDPTGIFARTEPHITF